MGRSPCCLKEEMNRGAWTAQEDKILTEYIRAHGQGKWRNLPMKAGLKRCGKSCRLRWLNYLRPDIKRGNISPDEEELIIRLHKLLGNRWSLIAGRLPGRTDNEIKNYWNTNLGKKVQNNEQIYDPGITQKSKSSDQQNNKIIKNTNSTKKIPHPITKVLEPPFPAVKTKAFKCSKVIIDLSPQKIENVDSQQVTKTNMLTPLQPLDGDYDSSNQMAKHTSSSASCGSKVDDASDLMMDLDVGDFCVSDLLHFQDNNLGDVCNNNNNCSPSSDHQAIIFSGETLQDYCRNLSDCVAFHEESNSFQSISPLLFDPEEEDWLRNYPSL